jgi:hypothetical protein
VLEDVEVLVLDLLTLCALLSGILVCGWSRIRVLLRDFTGELDVCFEGEQSLLILGSSVAA